jgi:hypothetical protein
MKTNMNTKKLVEVGLNKYGQRLDEYNEFGQSLEAEVWHFDALYDGSIALLPALECLIRPTQEKTHGTRENMSNRKPVAVGLNKYGQRLDEYNEFGQSLEAEVWHFDALVDVPVPPVPALEFLILPTQDKKPAATVNFSSQAAAHRQAA